jgi:tRNA (cmo5U34)-methyltransferase
VFKDGKPTQKFPQFYDTHINVTIPYYQAFNREIINLVKAVGHDPALWLDTGCGTGTLIGKATDEFPKTKFMLVDPSPEMMEIAENKLAGQSKERYKFLAVSATQDIVLPGDERPDVITAVLCHHYLHEEGRRLATKKCFELLKKGGIYITFENVRPFTSFGTELGKANWKNFQVAAGKQVDIAEEHIKRFGTEYFPITVEDHISLLRSCGFPVVELFWYSYMQAGFYCVK